MFSVYQIYRKVKRGPKSCGLEAEKRRQCSDNASTKAIAMSVNVTDLTASTSLHVDRLQLFSALKRTFILVLLKRLA